ncbi:BadM/Rrf2 family transcriptional regulator [Thermosulfidibacter takaii ABI70S6]|uniref:BadM/Rrf2 family transcriptional regulator n=1 Tax=Thermosulfidibacter takaii (strain DSM 17441 / JCM 13301 / NBRC 103674 / ABI70S6) TaxID=1298851 RepID=A0A0S3QVN4_THET7|nr:Rrf2 family transcriptional regulator [Thermosulfidibacter takaii]BAT72384.1 BadM/Rrf2 family transcriptional regulator [Thermosulfidibacter takaii ABI70S6]
MIKVSTKGRYGLRAMIEIGKAYGKGFMLLREIAKRQGISEKYLSHIIPQLRNHGLIKASRGAHGGYTLAKPPEKISLREIIEALEGPIFLVECVGAPDVCDMSSNCETRKLWKRLSESLLKELENITLADLLRGENENSE